MMFGLDSEKWQTLRQRVTVIPPSTKASFDEIVVVLTIKLYKFISYPCPFPLWKQNNFQSQSIIWSTIQQVKVQIHPESRLLNGYLVREFFRNYHLQNKNNIEQHVIPQYTNAIHPQLRYIMLYQFFAHPLRDNRKPVSTLDGVFPPALASLNLWLSKAGVSRCFFDMPVSFIVKTLAGGWNAPYSHYHAYSRRSQTNTSKEEYLHS